MQQTHADALGRKDEEAKALNATIEELQSNTSDFQQKLEDAARSKDEQENQLQETIESLRQEASALQERAEEQAAAKEKESADLTKVVEELQAKVHEHKQVAEEAKRKADEAVSGNTTVIEDLQNQVQAAQQQVHDVQSARKEAESKLQSVNEAHEKLLGQIEDLRLAREESSKESQQRQAEVAEMRETLDEAEAAKRSAESALQGVQEELGGLQKVFSTFEQDGQEKADAHAQALENQREELAEKHASELGKMRDEYQNLERQKAELEDGQRREMESLRKERDVMDAQRLALEDAQKEEREQLKNVQDSAEGRIRELEDRHKAELDQMRDDHGRELESLRQATADRGTSSAELESKYADLLQEKRALERILEDIEMQNDRKLRDRVRRADEAYYELKEQLDQAKEERTKQLDDQSRKHEEAVRELHDLIAKLREQHTKAIEEMASGHERDVRAVMDQHAQQIGEIEEGATRRAEAAGRERDYIHEKLLANLEAEHADALQKARAPSQQRAPSFEAGTPIAADTPSGGLSHIFVNREADGDETPGMIETPLAYASEDEHGYSPTPVYLKDGRRARAASLTTDAVQSPRVKQLESQNKDLFSALQAAQREVAEMKSSPFSSHRRENLRKAFPHPEDDDDGDEEAAEDPFASPSIRAHRSPVPTASATTAAPAAAHSSYSNDHDNGMSLEGTLESIRVQTEQLLEINEDFAAEQRRWSQRLSLSRSQRGGSMTPFRNSPLRGAEEGQRGYSPVTAS
ncbi:hypothetical protein KC334_g10483 [Hortaea werneckii]|nr:hypothetical protein KC334_g10483 [Hortaea werneckii]KAI7005516.1 hypothetical protein KC355_g8170 [Hortaea werneckii]